MGLRKDRKNFLNQPNMLSSKWGEGWWKGESSARCQDRSRYIQRHLGAFNVTVRLLATVSFQDSADCPSIRHWPPVTSPGHTRENTPGAVYLCISPDLAKRGAGTDLGAGRGKPGMLWRIKVPQPDHGKTCCRQLSLSGY